MMRAHPTRIAPPPDVERLIPRNIGKGVYYRLYPRKDGSVRLVWWVKAYDQQGRPVYESSDSSRYEDALRLQKRIIAQVEHLQRSGGATDSVRISELLDDMLNDTQVKPNSKYVYSLVIEGHLRPFFGKLRACKLTSEHLKQYRSRRKSELVERHIRTAAKSQIADGQRTQWDRSAGATVNRELSLLRIALRHAMKQTPPKVLQLPHFPMQSERDNVRKVVLRDEDYTALRDAFKDSGVQLLFIVSCHVGIRASELKRIKWSQVDFDRRVISLDKGKTKNRDARSAPIFGDMLPYLDREKRRRDEFYPDSPWVFSRAGKAIRAFRTEWCSATTRAGVPELHFHDLRRTAQRLMRRAGVDRITRMRIMGHKTEAMDIRYGVVEDEDVIAAGAKLDGTFRSIMAGPPNHSPTVAVATPALDPELLAKLTTLTSDKLRALLALLSK